MQKQALRGHGVFAVREGYWLSTSKGGFESPIPRHRKRKTGESPQRPKRLQSTRSLLKLTFADVNPGSQGCSSSGRRCHLVPVVTRVRIPYNLFRNLSAKVYYCAQQGIITVSAAEITSAQWACNSIGRVPVLQAGSCGFESRLVHFTPRDIA